MGERIQLVFTVRQRIERIMNQEDAHGSALSFPLEKVLYACSQAYQLVTGLRIHLYERGVLKQERLPCKVMSIGNITVGGTGKTPMTLYIADFLKRMGLKVAVVSRGYGGRAERTGGIVSDGETIRMKPDVAGDEPYLMSVKLNGVPVIVGKDRVRAGRLALRVFDSDVLLLDDGFQHVRLKRDLNLLLLDAANPFGNGHLLPRGTLREPLSQLGRADAFVLTQSETGMRVSDAVSHVQQIAPGRPVFRGTRIPDRLAGTEDGEIYPVEYLKGRRILAFAGIARNEDFREMVLGLGGNVVAFQSFPNHHYYSDEDLRSIAASGESVGAEFLVTTEKDHVRIGHRLPKPSKLLILKMVISFGADTGELEEYVQRSLMTSG